MVKTSFTTYNIFCLLDAVFSSEIKVKQSWAIKIKKMTKPIYLGICLENVVKKNNFNSKKLSLDGYSNGLYLIKNSMSE